MLCFLYDQKPRHPASFRYSHYPYWAGYFLVHTGTDGKHSVTECTEPNECTWRKSGPSVSEGESDPSSEWTAHNVARVQLGYHRRHCTAAGCGRQRGTGCEFRTHSSFVVFQ